MRYMRRLPFWQLIIVLVWTAPAPASEPDASQKLIGTALVASLQSGGHVIYIRHTATDHNQIDARIVEFGNCTSQRNLSEKGRKQAQDIGETFRSLEIPVGEIFTSPYCRTIDTGRLAFGSVVVWEDLGYTVRDTETETVRRAEVLRRALSTTPPEGRNTVVIGHTANLKEAAGIWPKLEGLAVIFRPSADGQFSHVASVEPDEWTTLAQLSRQPGSAGACGPKSESSAPCVSP